MSLSEEQATAEIDAALKAWTGAAYELAGRQNSYTADADGIEAAAIHVGVLRAAADVMLAALDDDGLGTEAMIYRVARQKMRAEIRHDRPDGVPEESR